MSTPLTLVDGVPRSFANVDPEDIESFTILKDASATAVYGVRGANGVIIINTKSGMKGSPKFSVRYTEGFTKPTQDHRLRRWRPSIWKCQTKHRPHVVVTALQPRGNREDPVRREDPYLYPNVDWMKEILRDFSRNRSANINIQGGSDKAVYYIGLAYYDEDGMYKDTKLADYNSNTFFRRYNATTSLTLNPFRSTEIKLGIQGYLANANYPGRSAVNNILIGILHAANIHRPDVSRRQARAPSREVTSTLWHSWAPPDMQTSGEARYIQTCVSPNSCTRVCR